MSCNIDDIIQIKINMFSQMNIIYMLK